MTGRATIHILTTDLALTVTDKPASKLLLWKTNELPGEVLIIGSAVHMQAVIDALDAAGYGVSEQPVLTEDDIWKSLNPKAEGS